MNTKFPYSDIRSKLQQMITESLVSMSDALKVNLGDYTPDIIIENIREEHYGDYACAISLNKELRGLYSKKKIELSKPYLFAKELAREIWRNKTNHQMLERIDSEAPGFINFTLKNRTLWKQLLFVHENFETICFLNSSQRHKILFEYVSANPTGPLNIVSARAAALGDACCNLLQNIGHSVEREYYVNDYGNQITLLGESGMLRYLETQDCVIKFSEEDGENSQAYAPGPGLPFPKEGYHGDYVTEIIQALLKEKKIEPLPTEKIQALRELSQTDSVAPSFLSANKLEEECVKLGRMLLTFILEQQKQDLAEFNIHFDNFFHESQLHETGALQNTQIKLKKYSYEKDGSVFFKSTDFGDDKDRVIIRNDGRPTYFLADVAYHSNKAKRAFSHIYNIWGPDHHGYIARLQGAMQALGFKGVFQIFIAQQVNLLKESKIFRMSKRSGNILKLSSLLQEVPIDVARYFFIMRSFDAPMDFDIDVAKDESEKNPYYYIAYAHARICSIFRKVKAKNWETFSSLELEEALTIMDWTPQRRRLLLHLTRFSEEMQIAAIELEPHRVATYLYSLANLFSQFYGLPENRILQQDPKTAAALLYLIQTVAMCIKRGLNLLGTQAPERLLHEHNENE